ncbi:MAG: hypothetical protein LBF62_13105 [Tannerellaceae bacterium]|jgi:integrase|nr:hypothetical protein [Tannerellaceae bacterium]
MAKMNLSFTFKNGDLCLCATVKGTSKRNYKKVSNLQAPNFDSWDVGQQRFIEPTQDAINNNRLLSEMKARYQLILDNCAVNSGKELFELYEKGVKVEAKRELTFGEYLEKIIADMKNGGVKMPSDTYTVYNTLLHKLEIEGSIIELPLNAIDDSHFEAFGMWVLKELKGVNYTGLMKIFHATISKARKHKLTKNILDYKYSDDAPIKQADIDRVINGVHVLTKKQHRKYLSLDLSTLPNAKQYKNKELYWDYTVFLCETKSRPGDVIALKLSNIIDDRIVYEPAKKKNYKDKNTTFVSAPLTPKAKEIILKYKGQSSKGYVFPFAMNEYDWDLSDAVSFRKWSNRRKKTIEQINHFLSDVKALLGVSKLTTYTFRHTAFTHAINKSDKPLLQIAKEGGTSRDMLEKHYYNYIQN